MDKENRTGEIIRWIQSEIADRHLGPGARLDEQGIAARFGVSKTPVREALIHLSALGIVELRQRRGPIISKMDVEQVVAMFEFMTGLEATAARLAASRMPPNLRKVLQEAHERSTAFLDDAEAYDRMNIEFHEIISAGAQNEYLDTTIKNTHARLRLYTPFPFQMAGRIEQSFADHEKLLSEILRGNAERAFTIMHDHLTTSGRIFADLVASISSCR